MEWRLSLLLRKESRKCWVWERNAFCGLHSAMEKRCEGSHWSYCHHCQFPLLASLHQQLPLFSMSRTTLFSLPIIPFSLSHSIIIIILCLQAYGVSMLPTLNVAGDVLLADHLSPRIGKVRHGDLVLVRSPLNPKTRLTKRVVAMEGDTVTYFDPKHSDAAQVALVCGVNALPSLHLLIFLLITHFVLYLHKHYSPKSRQLKK